MRQTLCYIPETLFGLPLFGWGLGVGLLLVFAFCLHAYQYVRDRKISGIGNSLGMIAIAGAMLVYVFPNIIEPERGIPIRGYGACLLVAILAALALVVHLAKRQNIATEMIYSLCFWTVLSGVLGARLFYVTQYWEEMFVFDRGELLFRESLLNVVNIAKGGLVVFGSILGGMLGALIFMIQNKMPVLRTFDVMSPAVVLGMAIGRFGCLLNGCCFGGVTDVSWGIVFPIGSPPHIHQVAHGNVFYYGLKFEEIDTPQRLLGTEPHRKMLMVAEVQPNSEAESLGVKPNMLLWNVSHKQNGQPVVWKFHTRREMAEVLSYWQRNFPNEKVRFDFFTDLSCSDVVSYQITPNSSEVLPVHPTQIYSSCLALLLCGTLLILGRLPFYQQRSGRIFATFMILYSVGRFLIEIVRTDEDSFLGTGLTISQNVSIIFCLAGIALFVYLRRSPNEKN
jgi:phosphatidylglycerol:prolipoprotein diacylglycerol transferase